MNIARCQFAFFSPAFMMTARGLAQPKSGQQDRRRGARDATDFARLFVYPRRWEPEIRDDPGVRWNDLLQPARRDQDQVATARRLTSGD